MHASITIIAHELGVQQQKILTAEETELLRWVNDNKTNEDQNLVEAVLENLKRICQGDKP